MKDIFSKRKVKVEVKAEVKETSLNSEKISLFIPT